MNHVRMDLQYFYLSTYYTVDSFSHPILIGEVNDELEALLGEKQETSWAYLTAWNPQSIPLDIKTNELRNAQLEKDLKPYFWLRGKGIGTSLNWVPEESFLVVGIPRSVAMRLAVQYGQKALVFGEKGESAELVFTVH